MRRTYGLDDESTKDVTSQKREEVTREVFRLFDEDRNGVVEKEEWMHKCMEGVRLPDFGVRPVSFASTKHTVQFMCGRLSYRLEC